MVCGNMPDRSTSEWSDNSFESYGAQLVMCFSWKPLHYADVGYKPSAAKVYGFQTCRTLTFSYPGVSYPRSL